MHHQSTQDEAITLAKAGDRHSLGCLLERSRAYMSALARSQVGRRLRSKLDADDLLQEAWLRAHKAIRRFRGTSEDEFLAWLRGILAHVLADQIRRYHGTDSRDPKLERPLQGEHNRSSGGFAGALAAPTSSPSRRVVRRESAVRLARLLDRLPPASRQVVTLKHFENLSFPEIARRMERTPHGVKHLWIRALRRLQHEVSSLDESI
jgi:RNA polymerase sigma-70 factor (ECF subfamily)